jgi:hypothetical protein
MGERKRRNTERTEDATSKTQGGWLDRGESLTPVSNAPTTFPIGKIGLGL